MDLVSMVRSVERDGDERIIVELTNKLALGYEKPDESIGQTGILCREISEAIYNMQEMDDVDLEDYLLDAKNLETGEILECSPEAGTFFRKYVQREKNEQKALYERIIAPIETGISLYRNKDPIMGLPLALGLTLTWPITGLPSLILIATQGENLGSGGIGLGLLAAAPLMVPSLIKDALVRRKGKKIVNKEILLTEPDGKSPGVKFFGPKNASPDCYESILLSFPDGSVLREDLGFYPSPHFSASVCESEYKKSELFLPIGEEESRQVQNYSNLFTQRMDASHPLGLEVQKEDHYRLLRHIGFLPGSNREDGPYRTAG